MTPRINFRISECHHRFSIDLIIIFSAKNGKLFLDHTDPLTNHVAYAAIWYEQRDDTMDYYSRPLRIAAIKLPQTQFPRTDRLQHYRVGLFNGLW